MSLWESDQAFAKLLDILKCTAPAREFALFTNNNHTPPPLEILRPRFATLKRRIEVMRNLGYTVGINHLCTLGHANENVRHAATGGRLMVDSHGRELPGNFCPADPVWRENYIRECYQLAAECRPDFIWIDDDVRVGNHGKILDFGCFCPECFAKMAKYLGFTGKLSELPDFFECVDLTERRRRRQALLDYNSEVITDLLRFIEQTVHAVDPGIILGQMDGLETVSGLDLPGHAAALAGPEKQKVWWRPGGGFYFDRCPEEMLDKANRIGREAALLPSTVAVIQSELESFNYQRLNKSDAMTALEPQIYCAAGATGVAYNVFGETFWDDFEVYLPLIKTLNGNRRFLDRIAVANQRQMPRGIFDGTGADIHLSHRGNDGKWLTLAGADDAGFLGSEIQKMGLPAAYSAAEADVYAVTGQIVEAMSDRQIETMLTQGAYLDGFALTELNARGFGELTGFAVKEIIEEDAIEEFLPHILNAGAAGKSRNGRQSFWRQPAFILESAAGAEILSRCVDYADIELGKCLSGVFTNRLGGRIAVAGYYPWGTLSYRSQSERIKTLFRWLAQDRLGAYLTSYHRAAVWVRPGSSIIVWNMSADAMLDAKLMVLDAAPALTAYDVNDREYVLPCTKKDGNDCVFELPPVAPWQMLLIPR